MTAVATPATRVMSRQFGGADLLQDGLPAAAGDYAELFELQARAYR